MKALLWVFLFFPVVLSNAAAITPDEDAEKIRNARLQEILDWALDEKGTREACKYISYISTPPPPMKVALTFDDGPSPSGTPHTLDVLKKYGIAGTFFMLGANASRFPDVAERVSHEESLLIGNHSWNHPNFHTLSFEAQQEQILRSRNVLERYQSQKYFRFPYGNSTCDSIRFLHERTHAIVGWHVDSCDWAFNRTGTVSVGDAKICGVKSENRSNFVRHVVDSLKGRRGGILLMHETQPNTIAQLETIIDELRKEGFTFTRLDDPEFKSSMR